MSDKNKPEKTIVVKKTYTIEEIQYSDDTFTLDRTNDGFTAIELLGLCEMAQLEILDQIRGGIKPDTIKRSIVEARNQENE